MYVFIPSFGITAHRTELVRQKCEGVEIHVVKYRTLIYRDFANLRRNPSEWCKALTMELPARVREKKWGIVIVDGPNGSHGPEAPGRFQSLYEAANLVTPDGYIIVDDCGRAVERDMSRLFYGRDKLLKKIRRGNKDEVR